MFYEHREDLPIALQRNLPIEAQELYRREYNRTWEIYQYTYQKLGATSAEEVAHRKAWGKVKRQFTTNYDGTWRPRNAP
ncbi:MAG: ChaB family protein [Candidatus Saccharibacteria bacterium]